MTSNPAAGEIDEALADYVRMSAAQRVAIARALAAWAKLRAAVPDTDQRLGTLLTHLPELVEGLSFVLDRERGLAVHAPSGSRAALLLERGSVWFRGGDWRSVALACVSSETPSNP